MNDYVEIVLRRNRGWPWPESSWGLTPMFGEDGWCKACGLPQHPQTGSIVLQRRGLTPTGGWVPHWQFDVYCLASGLVERAARAFDLKFLPVYAPTGEKYPAAQVVINSSAQEWFGPQEIDKIIAAIHGVGFDTCSACDRRRWMPVGMDVLPSPPASVFTAEPPVIASAEWFGAGFQSFRQILWRRDVADFLLQEAPKDFKTQEVKP